MLWAADLNDFRQASEGFKSIEQVQDAVLAASKVDPFAKIREMARVDPNWGLTTPPHKIPQLEPVPPVPAPAVGRPSPSAITAVTPSRLAGRRASLHQAREMKERNMRPCPAPAASPPFRVQKRTLLGPAPKRPAHPGGPAGNQATGGTWTETRQIPGSFPDS
ncbi:hypothetical protein CDD83_3908 [Cordyceps sp. RAO-2017]|nr:hypothetical protein CDD83_3908 [Cordyceps sp. RAO-2017]